MRRQSWIISLLLLAVAVGLSWKLRADWLRGNQRYANLSGASAQSRASVPATLPGQPVTVSGAELIVQNNLFSIDRNNTVATIAVTKATPPDPILIGAMSLGPGRDFALMAEGGPQPGPSRQVKEGEMIGDFKVVKIAGTFVIVSYDGQEKRIEVSFSRVTQVAAPYTPPAQAEAPAPRNNSMAVRTIAPPPPPPPGTIISNLMGTARTSLQMFGPGVPDNYPAGTVINGYMKKVHPWPFGGQQISWEKVQQ